MGGDYYDRDVVQTESNQNYSTEFTGFEGPDKQIHSSLLPTRWADDPLFTEAKNPIIFALDVTGSMGDWVKIIYDKMPMFYGQIMMQNYLTDPALSFCAIGDSKADDTPLQITEFGQGKEIDQLIPKMVLQRSGGGNEHESYELASYFYQHNVDMPNTELPFFFVTGDEGYWDEVDANTILKVFGKGLKGEKLDSRESWARLKEKYNVFHIHKPYMSANYEKKIHKQWVDALGEERVLDIVTPKACVDVMLGAIALTSGRSLDSYIADMKTRGQTPDRIQEVIRALNKYSEKLESKEIIVTKGSQKRVENLKQEELLNKNLNELNKKVELVEEKKSQVSTKDVEEIRVLFEKAVLDDMDDDSLKYRQDLIELKKAIGYKIPNEFVCPITQELFVEPVMTTDGITFEKKAIECWLEVHDFSPVTGKALDNKSLLPNFAVKQLIQGLYQSSK